MPKIIVSNLPTNFTVEDTKSIYKKYGQILNITKSKLNFFITYKTREECTKAIEGTNTKIYNKSSPLKVDYAYDRDCKVFIFNLPLDSDLVDVNVFFSYYGNIEYSKFIKNVCMVIYENRKDAAKLINLSNKITYKGSLVSIRNNIKNEVQEDDKKCVFVYNLSEEITEMDFLKMFSKYGPVLSSGIVKGRGFVNFEKEVSAYKAVKYMDNMKIKSKKIRVILKSNK